MARADNGSVDQGGFKVYDAKQLPKIDAMRRDKSQPDFYGIPILTDAQVLFTTAEQLGGHPASCYTCKEQTRDLTCERLGPMIKVEKVTGSKDSGEAIEYWPCCSMHEYNCGERQTGAPKYHDALDTPESIGLVWINAPKPGQEFGGANCGGGNGGDDCDHYLTYGKNLPKWESTEGYCRVLAHDVENGAVCAAWHDDDELPFAEAQMLIRGDTVDTVDKRRMARAIIGRSD